MNVPEISVHQQIDGLPVLVQRAADALLAAKTSAEVLEARDVAGIAYTAAKIAGRLARAKQAHDSLLSEVYRAQADAIRVVAGAKIRLADEYDAAQERGDVAGQDRTCVGTDNAPSTAEDIGLRRDEIHEARQIRDAERENPGLINRALDAMVKPEPTHDDPNPKPVEPTKAKLHREIIEKPRRDNDVRALWLWGRLKDFERMGILSTSPAFLLGQMTPPMRAEALAVVPKVRAFLKCMEIKT